MALNEFLTKLGDEVVDVDEGRRMYTFQDSKC